MIKKRRLLVFLGIFVFLSFMGLMSAVSAQQSDFTHVISNSEDWKDVYSTLHYATLSGAGSDFLASTRHGPLLLNGINKNNNIRVVTSSSDSFVINYDNDIRNANFEDADELVVDNANLELIDELPEINNFIIVGDTYGYNAVAVAPYAVLNRAWVFLADRTNIEEIDSILSNREVDEVMIYGFVDREVRDTLEKYNPEIIDNGDRFKDNIEIVERYIEINPTKQVTLTNGEFIEKEIMSGVEPALFTGKENVPDQIRDYIQSSDIEVGVLIGADLVGAATNIRRSTGISVIVKFARGARAPTGAIAAVEGLDLFYLPIPIMQLDIASAKYNRATSQLELTYKSDSNVPVFFRGTITPRTDSGEQTRVGDVEPIFIAPEDFKTVVYPDLEFTGEDITLEIFTLYGDTPTSLEKILERNIDVETVNIIDGCDVEIDNAKYSKGKDNFIIKLNNIGSVECWVDVELEEVVIDGAERTIGSEGSIKIRPGRSGKVVIEQEMTDEDLAENDFVDVVAYYGEREDSLVKILRGRFNLDIELISFATIGLLTLGMIVILAIIIVLFILWKRRKDDDDDW